MVGRGHDVQVIEVHSDDDDDWRCFGWSRRDSVVTPLATVWQKLGALAGTSGLLSKRGAVQETMLERFPKQTFATAT
jgi:hypothetical protein